MKIHLGVLDFDNNCRVIGYREKPETTYHVSMGVYVYEPRVLAFVERGKYLDFPDPRINTYSRWRKSVRDAL